MIFLSQAVLFLHPIGDLLGSDGRSNTFSHLKDAIMFKRRKLLEFIIYDALLQGVSLENPYACVQKSCGSATEQLGSLDA